MKITSAVVLLITVIVSNLLTGCRLIPFNPADRSLSPPEEIPGSMAYVAQGILNLAGSDPTTLDPALAGDAVSHDYVVQIFSGLLRFDDNLEPAPDIAGRWNISPDGTVYTFYLRNDVTFHDGRKVKAKDFKFSWERASTPAVGSNTALTYLGDIVGVKDMLAGKVDSIRGVKVIDDYTLQVTIDSPKSYFLSKMTYPTAFVVDKYNVKTDKIWWLNPNGTGPFKLVRYDKQKQLVLDRNDIYYGDKARITSVVFSILQGVPMNLYETGKIDAVGVSFPYIERASDPLGPFAGQLTETPELSVYYIGFNSAEPPFDDVNIRIAFSCAIDKNKLVSLAFKNMAEVAYGFLPPGMPGFNDGMSGISFDVERAKELIEKSKYGSVANLPSITVTSSGEGGGVSTSLEALVYQWKQNLGVDINIRLLEPERYTYSLDSELDQMFDFGWIADYPHPQDFLDILFHSGAYYNYGGYNNADVDALIDQANRIQDFATATELYRQAEQKLVNDAAALPLFFWRNYILVKPYIHGYKLNPLGFVMLNNVSVDPH